MIKLTGLWLNTAKDGSSYMAGTLGGARVMVFKNGFKQEGDSSPDYVMYLAPKQDRQQEVPQGDEPGW